MGTIGEPEREAPWVGPAPEREPVREPAPSRPAPKPEREPVPA